MNGWANLSSIHYGVTPVENLTTRKLFNRPIWYKNFFSNHFFNNRVYSKYFLDIPLLKGRTTLSHRVRDVSTTSQKTNKYYNQYTYHRSKNTVTSVLCLVVRKAFHRW